MNRLWYIPIALLGVGVPTCVSVYLVVKKQEQEQEDPYKDDVAFRDFRGSPFYTGYYEDDTRYKKDYLLKKFIDHAERNLMIIEHFSVKKIECGIIRTFDRPENYFKPKGREATREEAASIQREYLDFLKKMNDNSVSRRELNDMGYKLFLKGQCKYEY